MKAKDRIMMLSIINSTNSKNCELNPSQKEWLADHPDFKNKLYKQKKFYGHLNTLSSAYLLPGEITIEELICELDLSDKMYR
jgi:hypothetical protein